MATLFYTRDFFRFKTEESIAYLGVSNSFEINHREIIPSLSDYAKMEWSQFKNGRVNIRYLGEEGQAIFNKRRKCVIFTPFLNNEPLPFQRMEESILVIWG